MPFPIFIASVENHEGIMQQYGVPHVQQGGAPQPQYGVPQAQVTVFKKEQLEHLVILAILQ